MRSRTLKVTVTLNMDSWTLTRVYWPGSYAELEGIREGIAVEFPTAYCVRMAIIEGARRRHPMDD